MGTKYAYHFAAQRVDKYSAEILKGTYTGVIHTDHRILDNGSYLGAKKKVNEFCRETFNTDPSRVTLFITSFSFLGEVDEC